ncbi:hypothetical protein ACFFX0_14800 [Citricoccus parietis]|uniref:Uncharacterized protein n=1 Tax=Citricoccus parietis TaxID=592307 RepID=A0ABV5G0E7_9MICC
MAPWRSSRSPWPPRASCSPANGWPPGSPRSVSSWPPCRTSSWPWCWAGWTSRGSWSSS